MSSADLKYAHEDAEGWYMEPVHPGASVAWAASLALDSAGLPHVSCDSNQDTGSEPRYAVNDSSGWYLQVVTDQHGRLPESSFVLDEEGLPHITLYHGASNGTPACAYAETVRAETASGRGTRGRKICVAGGLRLCGATRSGPVYRIYSGDTYLVWWDFHGQRGDCLPSRAHPLRIRATNPAAHDVTRLTVLD